MANNISLGIVIGAALSSTVGRAFQSLDQRATGLGRSLQQVRLGRAAGADVARYRTQLETLRATQQQFGASNTHLWGQIARTERSLRDAERAAERYGLDVGNITRENRRLLQSEQAIARQLQRTNQLRSNRDQRANLGGQIVGTIGMAYAAALPVKKAIEFESVMADVRKVVDMTDAEFKAMSKSILDMSATMPMAASGIGAIMSAAGQSGIAKSELLDFAKAAVQMGVAFDLTGDQAGQMMANWRAGMNLSQAETVALADAVNHLSNNMNATAPAIGEVVQRQGAVARAAGLSAVQTAALSAALLSSGAAPEIAATALKNLTNALTKGGSATKSQIAVFKQLGFDSTAVAASMQKDAAGTIKNVFEALAKAPKEIQGSLVGGLFGEEAKGAISPLLANMGNLTKAFAETADAGKFSGSMLAEYEVRSKTTANSLELLSGKTTRLAINIGSLLLPALNTVVGALGGGIGAVTGLAEKFPLLTQVIVGAAVGLVALKVVTLAGGFAMTILSDGLVIAGGIMDFFRLSTMRANAALVWQKAVALGTAIQQKALAISTGVVTAAQWLWNAAVSASSIGRVAIGIAAMAVAQKATAVWTGVVTAAQWLWNAALSANPIGLVVIGITAFGALAYTVYKNWEPIMNWFQEKFAWLSGAVDWVKGIGGVIGGAVSAVGGAIGLTSAPNPVIGSAALSKSTKGSEVLAKALAPPVSAAPAANPATSPRVTPVGNQTNTFHITQLPGEDQKGLADRVAATLRRQQQADQRRALYD